MCTTLCFEFVLPDIINSLNILYAFIWFVTNLLGDKCMILSLSLFMIVSCIPERAPHFCYIATSIINTTGLYHQYQEGKEVPVAYRDNNIAYD